MPALELDWNDQVRHFTCISMKAKPSILARVSEVNLHLLRVFVAVVDCGGIAAAELELDIAMSTISRHVKALEVCIGFVLCRRGRSGFALTPEGESVFIAARRLLAATDAFRTTVLDVKRKMAGDLHVAIFEKTVSNPRSRISVAVSQFRMQAPDVHLHLHVGAITSIEQGVLEGRFQLGIIPEHRRSESLVYSELFSETMLLYAGQAHPWFKMHNRRLGWDDLREQSLAALGYHSPNQLLTRSHRLSPQGTASEQEAVATLVLSGAYVGFLPDHYAHQFVCARRMHAVEPKVFRYDCQFVCLRRRSPVLSRAAKAFWKHLVLAHADSAIDPPLQ